MVPLRILIAGFILTCLAGTGSGCWRRRRYYPSPPPANESPYFTSCPSTISVNAPTGQTNAEVTWANPQAKDKEDGTLTPNQISGNPRGSMFPEGVSIVKYEVHDSKSSRATCTFSVNVVVTECYPQVPYPEHGSRICSDLPSRRENIYGSECQFTCDQGYELTGVSSTVSCEESGYWSDSFPTCEPVDCGDPSAVITEDLSCPRGHVYPEACYLLCQRGYQPTDVSFISCTATGQWSFASPCTDVEKPEFLNGCPPNQQLFTGPLESPVAVTWNIPMTSDNSGGPVTVTSQPLEGTFLGAGLHSIKFTATDAAGNSEYCNTVIAIQAKECPSFPSPANSQVTCSHGYVEGSECTVNCNDGYEVNGQATLTCTGTETWDSPPPSCAAVVCPPPPSVDHGHFSCSAAHVFQSECFLYCDDGFRNQDEANVRCLANASWTNAGFCEDIEPPEFTNGCPANIEQYAARLGEETRFTWDDPDVTDNSGQPVQLVSDVTSGSVFQSGVTFVTYTASDVAGNERTCQFSITATTSVCEVPDLEMPNRARTLMTYDCADGHVLGASCTLSCLYSSQLVGSDIITCERDNNTYPPTSYWEWPGSPTAVPECRETVCPDLPAPQNGALACYLGNYGYNCLMSCNEDYDTNAQTDGKFECTNSNGFWFPSNVPDCTEYLRPSDVRLHADVFYYAGNCETSLDELRQNFIDRINNSTWKDACINVPLCTAENVEVTCGAISGRRKRNANENSERVRRQTQTDDFYVQFDFDIVITYDEGSKTREETYQDFKAMLAIVQTNLQADADAGDFDFLGLETYEYSVGYPTLHADCPPGTFFEKLDTTEYISCRGCGSGFYVTEGSTQCEACPVGSYTELDNATSCTPCPPGWSTPTTGSRNSSDCKEICQAGSSSHDGFVPCLQCPAGKFQAHVGAKTCELCPAGTWVSASGSTGVDQCVPADVSLNGTTLSAFLNGQWSSLTSTAWISLETGALTLVEFDFDVDDYVPFSVNLYTSAADASLLSTDSATSASVLVEPDTWSRLLLIVDLETATTTVYHQDTILLAFTQTLFTSQPSAILNISVLEGKAIVGGLYAVDRVLTESEISASSTTCAGNNTDNILAWSPPAASLQIPSLCDAVDECREQPCGDFACVNGRGTFECHCEDGWSGDTCNEPPDPCQEHDCQNGATCVPGNTFTTYTCLCGDEFSGTLCSLIKVHGGYGDWTMWTECSATCGGSQQRHRLCNNPAPQNGGSDCVGASVDTRVCGETFCPIQGAWSEWTSWGQCSASCQGGERTRTRTCDNPSPQFGGGDCDGPSIEVEACNADACPVHGGYGEWSEWPPCSVTCGGGQTIRNRTCNNPAPANGGNACSGPPSETEVCNEGQCPECAELVLSQGTLPLACNETNNPYLKSCRLECAQGYSSLFEFPLYTCGEETAYLWNHQRDASLVPPLPGCERPKTIMYASATQHVKMNAGCDESTDSIVLSGVESNIKSIPCVQQKVCSAQVQSSCVQAETGRKKRSTDSLQITVQVTVDFGPSQTYADNDTSLAEYDGLMEVAVESADIAFANDTEALFTVVAGNQSFTPDVASISYSISTQCPAGSVPYEAFCLDCPMGYKEVNGECVPCPLGQYQDESGSTQCKPCPGGLSWDVMAALSSDQCILTFIIDDADMPDDDSDIPGEEKQKADSALPIIVGVTCAVVVAVAAFLAMIAIYKCQRRKGTKGQRYKGKPRPLSACSRRVSPAPWHDHDVPMKVSPPLYSELPPVSPRDLHFEQTGHGAMPVKRNSLASVGTVEA